MKKLLISFTMLSTATLLTACASPQPRWYKPGVNYEDTHSYIQECRYNIGMNKMSEAKENRLFVACMEKNGFRFISI